MENSPLLAALWNMFVVLAITAVGGAILVAVLVALVVVVSKVVGLVKVRVFKIEPLPPAS